MAITQTTKLPLEFGYFNVNYHKFKNGFCISFVLGNISSNIPIVRIHSACLFGEAFHSLDCDCRDQLTEALKLIKQEKCGVVIYTYSEGRGIGLENKIKSIEIERTQKVDTVEAFEILGFRSDLREYEIEIQALVDLNTNKQIKLISGNPNKINALINAKFDIVEKIDIDVVVNKYNKSELLAKKNKLGYKYKINL